MTQIAIVLYPGFTALDFIGPYEVLHRLPGAEVRFLWHEPGPITADSASLVIGATHSFGETPSPDVILVPGGLTTVEHARDEKLLDWVRTADRTATWTTSVCSGSLILAAAGLLDGKRATSHWSVLPLLKTLGARAVGDERVVREGSIVSSAGVSAGIDLALWLAGQIGGEDRAKAIQLGIEYDPQPPFDSGHMSKASAKTKAAATAMLARDVAIPATLSAGTQLLWSHALAAARTKVRPALRIGAVAAPRWAIFLAHVAVGRLGGLGVGGVPGGGRLHLNRRGIRGLRQRPRAIRDGGRPRAAGVAAEPRRDETAVEVRRHGHPGHHEPA